MTDRFKSRTAFVFGLALLAFVVLYALYRTPDTFLLSLAGLLFAVLFHAVAKQIARFMPYGAALALTLVTLLGVLGLFSLTLGPRIGDQIGGLVTSLPSSVSGVEQVLERRAWGRWLLDEIPLFEDDSGTALSLTTLGATASGIVPRLMGFVGSLSSVFKNALYVLLISIFFAAGAGTYVRGFAKLFPDEAKAQRVVYRVYATLRGWLLGQFVAMLAVGTLVGLGLWFLGVPFALGLGFIVFVLEFVPTIGPFLASIPALLLASTQGFNTMLWVVGLFVLVELIEGNLILPLIHKRAVDLPPAVTLFSIFIMGTLFGLLGVLVAAPLAAVVVTLVKMLYVRDEFGREVDLPGNRNKPKDPESALVQSSHAERSNA